jgi:hypothetical protein
MRLVAFVLGIALAGQVLASQDPAIPKEDPRAIIDRLRSKRFPETEDRLEAKDVGARAQMLQDRIIEDLDKLLDQSDDNTGRRRSSGNADRNRSKDAAAQKPGEVKTKAAPSIGTQADKNDKRGDNLATDREPRKASTVAEPARDTWLPLPARKRQEMDAYGKDKPLPKYEQLVGEYFRTIAEQKRK